MNNSPKDYLTDRVAELEKKLFSSYKEPYPIDGISLHCDKCKKNLIAFLTETIQQSMEVGRNEYIAEQLMQEGNPTPYIGIDTPDRKLKKAIERVSSSQQSK